MNVERARELRKLIVALAQTGLTDQEALENKELYDFWKAGINVKGGEKYRYKDLLYAVYKGKDHTTQVGWEPDVATSLFYVVDEDHSGGEDDVIPWASGMILENGKYYSDEGVKYYCFRDSGNPLYYPLSQLVGLYVNVVE